MEYIPAANLKLIEKEEEDEKVVRKIIRKTIAEKYGVKIPDKEVKRVDLFTKLADGRNLRIEHEYSRQDPVSNVAKAWLCAVEFGEEFVLMQVFSGWYDVDRSRYQNATFIAKQMEEWAHRKNHRLLYFPIRYSYNPKKEGNVLDQTACDEVAREISQNLPTI